MTRQGEICVGRLTIEMRPNDLCKNPLNTPYADRRVVETMEARSLLIGQLTNTWRLCTMLRMALLFFIVAILAAIFGFGGIAGASAGIAKILFFVFLVLFAIAFLSGRRVVA